MDERREDWHHGVDENLASLNAGQRIWDRDIKQIRRALADIDHLLRGDTEKETDGFIPRLHRLENEINLLRAVVLTDKAGNKGLDARVEQLESMERRSDMRNKLWIAIVGLISAALVGAMANLDRLETYFHKKPTDPLEIAIERAKRPRAKRRVIIRQVPAEDPDTQ